MVAVWVSRKSEKTQVKSLKPPSLLTIEGMAVATMLTSLAARDSAHSILVPGGVESDGRTDTVWPDGRRASRRPGLLVVVSVREFIFVIGGSVVLSLLVLAAIWPW